MNDSDASVVAFVTAPLAPSLIIALTSPGLGGGLDAGVPTLIVLSLLFYLPSLVAVGLLAFPVFLILRRRQTVQLWHCIACGVIGGALVSWLMWAEVAPLVLFTGGVTGMVFWAVRWLALRRNPRPA